MKYGNLEALMHVIESQEQEKEVQFLAAAQQEANQISQKIFEEGKQKLANRQAKFQKELAAKKAQELTRIKMREQQKISLFKQQLILGGLEQVQLACERLDADEYIALLQHHLQLNGGEPRIIVPTRYEKIVLEKITSHDRIEVTDKLDSGFILSYPEYDINHDFSQLFQFRKQELLKRMMELLFGDEEL